MQENTYFKHYEGADPYIFISYAHSDSGEVMKILTDMHRRGFRLWYDEGIEVGSEWQECIASHLMDADMMIAFISNAYMKSDNCRKEMAYALSKKKKVINIFLEETRLSPGMELQLGNIYAIMKYTYPSDGYFYAKLYGAEMFKVHNYGCGDTEVDFTKKDERAAERQQRVSRKKKPAEKTKKPRKKWVAPLVVFCLLLALVIAGAVVGYFNGYLQRLTTDTVKPVTLAGDTVAVFENKTVEKAAREYTGKSSGDITVSELTGLTSLYIAGDEYWFTQPQKGIFAAATEDKAELIDPDGRTRTVSRGDISSLADFAYFPSLTTLWLQFESLGSLETMPACLIEQLNIAGNRVTSLNGICNLSKLRELTTDGCPLKDLASLEKCLDLRDASFLGGNVSDYSVIKPLVKFTSAAVSNSTLSEIQPILNNGHLSSLYLENCDVRGAFFRSFDKERKLVSLTMVGCKLDSLTNIEEFTALAGLDIESTTGIADWSPITQLPALTVLQIDKAMEEPMAAITGSAAFEVKVK